MPSVEKKTFATEAAEVMEPGHDAWVVGDTKAITYEFHGIWGEAG